MAKLIEDAKAQFGALSDREQKLVLLTASVVAVFVLFVSFWWTQSSIDKKKKNIRIKQEELELVESKRSAYQAALKAEEDAKNRLKRNNVSLYSKIQEAAKSQGIELRDLNESKVPVKGADDVEEVRVDVNLKDVSVDALNNFLEGLEGRRQNGLIKITKLKVATRHENDQMLNVNMTVSTWKERK